MNHSQTRTKILATIGPASSSIETLQELIRNGASAFRLNFSHGSYPEHLNSIHNIRIAAKSLNKFVAIVQDLQGPKIRVRNFENGFVVLEEDEQFIITTRDISLGNKRIVSTNHKNLAREVAVGSKMLLDDGYIILEVEDIVGEDIITKVKKGGKLSDNKGIVVPGLASTLPSLTEKDTNDLKFGLENGVDFVALSFVRQKEDVLGLKQMIKELGYSVQVIAKIERPEAVANIDGIISVADAIMIARGDLGLEMEPEKVPIVQKEVLKKCRFYGKPSIVATQMLESMIQNPRPTRAEANDVANAVLDGADCLMLSAETSVGKYPSEAVEYMRKIISEVEASENFQVAMKNQAVEICPEIWDAVSKASCIIAEQIGAKAIVPLTQSGFTAQVISKYRPQVPIYSITESKEVAERLCLVWGVESFLNTNETCISQDFINNNLKKIIPCKTDDTFVVVSCKKPKHDTEGSFIKIIKC